MSENKSWNTIREEIRDAIGQSLQTEIVVTRRGRRFQRRSPDIKKNMAPENMVLKNMAQRSTAPESMEQPGKAAVKRCLYR